MFAREEEAFLPPRVRRSREHSHGLLAADGRDRWQDELSERP